MADVKKSEISPHVEEFQIFHTTDVEKYEVLPNLEEFHPVFVVKSVLCNLRCFLQNQFCRDLRAFV